MNLKEMSTDKAIEIICEVSPHIEKILNDKDVKELFKQIEIKSDNDKEKAFDAGIKKVFSCVPKLLKRNKESFFAILSIVDEKDIEEIKQQNIFTTIVEIKELILNEDIRQLFLSISK